MFFTRTSCAVRTGKSGILFSIPLFFLRRVCYNGASIMKKVHSAGFRPVTFVHFCHHTPQGDGEFYACKSTCKSIVFFSFPQSHPARGRRIRLYLAEVDDLNMISHPARGRRKPLLRLETKKSHPARGRWKFHLNWEKVAKRITSHPARGRRISQCLRHFCIIQRGASHPARGHRRPPRFTAQFCAAKRGGCFFVKFWAVPDFFPQFFQLREFPQLLY